jgi:hypothetical protein
MISEATNSLREATMVVGLEMPDGLHHTTRDLVVGFARALAVKLHRAEQKYGYSDEWAAPNWKAECQLHLLRHVAKGDPLDVAAYCAFMWRHGWPTISEPFAPHLPPDLWCNLEKLKNAGRGSDDAGNIRSSFG